MTRKGLTYDRDGCVGGRCGHDGQEWQEICATHVATDTALRMRWREDYYRTARPDPERVRFDLGNAEGLI